MSASKELFLRMSEEEFLDLSSDARAKLAPKVYRQSDDDLQELFEDEMYRKLYAEYKALKNDLNERKYWLREKRRSGNS